VTKNLLVMRDVDVLQELARYDAAAVFVSVTSLRGELQAKMEPRTAHPRGRLLAIETLAKAGIPVGVMVAPVIPGLTDYEIPRILKAAANAGARFAGCTPVRLPYGVKHLFEQWLTQHFPERKEKVLHRIREIRGGKLNDSKFGSRMRGTGNYAELIRRLFLHARHRAGIGRHGPRLSTAHFRRPFTGQPLPFPK
jgi:DNA repair photolyase